MKRLLFIPLLFCALLGMAQNKVTVTPSQPLDNAVSGHYAAWTADGLQTYGGCNFPDVPCADGGQKVYYPQAYGASVQVPNGALFLGGMDAHGSLSECTFISATDGTSTPIESLPVGLDNFAATYHDGMVWVAGGQTNGTPNRNVYALQFPSGKVKSENGKLKAEPTVDASQSGKVEGENSGVWSKVAELPDECRLQPCVAVQNTVSGKALFIFGGYQPKTESMAPMVHTDGVYMPIVELQKGNTAPTQWKHTSQTMAWAASGERKQHLQAIVGTTCTPVGYSHVMFFGGVDHDIFLEAITDQPYDYHNHEPEWYKFRKDVLIYHTVTDSWGLLPGNSLLARAGACLTPEVGGKGAHRWSVHAYRRTEERRCDTLETHLADIGMDREQQRH